MGLGSFHIYFFLVFRLNSGDFYKVTINNKKNYRKENTMKRTLKKLVIILALVIGVSTGCGTQSVATTDSATELEYSIPMFVSFPDEQDEESEELEDPRESIQTDVIATADEQTLAVIKDCHKLIIDYFEKRDLDVASQIAQLENVYLFKQHQVDEMFLDGYYKPGTHDVYLSQDILEDEDYLRFTYTHEIMHYLGCVDSETAMLQEGMADAITEEILGYAYTESYDAPRFLCHQLLISDPDILAYILDGGDIDDRIDTRLKDVPREWYVEEHSMKLSDILDVLLYQIEYSEEFGIDSESYESFVNQCQAIVLAYCGTFNISEKQMNEIDEYLIYFDNKF